MKAYATELMDKLSGMADENQQTPEGQLDIYGIDKLRFLDIPYTKLAELADEIGAPSHSLAMELWESDQYEAKILSCMLSDPALVTGEQADAWAESLDSWMLCDYCCATILWQIPGAMEKAAEWANADRETLICAGFSLIAAIAANTPPNTEEELGFFDSALFLARKQASHDNLQIRRAVSTALQQIGRRSEDWHEAAVETAEEIAAQPSENARWVASQALGGLLSSRVLKSFQDKS